MSSDERNPESECNQMHVFRSTAIQEFSVSEATVKKPSRLRGNFRGLQLLVTKLSKTSQSFDQSKTFFTEESRDYASLHERNEISKICQH